jgi:hypothetical protein
MSDEEAWMAARRSRPDRQNPAPPRDGDALLRERLEFARRSLERNGVLAGAQSRRLSVRLDPGLVAEAKRRSGLDSDSEVVAAALALMAGGDDFGLWLVSQEGRLPADFELAV